MPIKFILYKNLYFIKIPAFGTSNSCGCLFIIIDKELFSNAHLGVYEAITVVYPSDP